MIHMNFKLAQERQYQNLYVLFRNNLNQIKKYCLKF